MNKFKNFIIIFPILILLFFITEIVYIFLTTDYYVAHRIVRLIIFIIFSIFLGLHIVSRSRKEKDLLIWNTNLLCAGLDSLNDNFTILDKDLRIIYTNYKMFDQIMPKERLKTIRNQKIIEVFDSMDKIVDINEKLKEALREKKECKFIFEINNHKYLMFIGLLYKKNDEIIGLTCFTTKFVEEENIIKI